MNSSMQQKRKMSDIISNFVYQTFCDETNQFQPVEFGKFVGDLTKGGTDSINAVKTVLIPRVIKKNKANNERGNKVILDVLQGVLTSNPRLLEGLKNGSSIN